MHSEVYECEVCAVRSRTRTSIPVLTFWTALIACLLCLPAHAAVVLTVVPAVQNVSTGGHLSASIVISGLPASSAPSLSTFDFDLAFDPAVLSFASASFGDAVLGDQLDLFALGSITAATPSGAAVNLYQLSFDTIDDLNALQAGTFTLATVLFDALESGTSPLGLSVNALGNAEGLPLSATVLGGTVTVVPTSTVPEPSTAALLATALFGGFLFRKRCGLR